MIQTQDCMRKKNEPVLRSRVHFHFDQKIANLQMTVGCSLMKWSHAPLQQRASSASLPSCSGRTSNVALAGCAARIDVTSVTALAQWSFTCLVLNAVDSNGE